MTGQAEFAGPGPGTVGQVKEPTPIETLSFEDAMAELETIVQKLERGQLSLDDSIAAFERGTALRQRCESALKEAETRIEKLTVTANGEVQAEAFKA